jgi:hypothetical protein
MHIYVLLKAENHDFLEMCGINLCLAICLHRGLVHYDNLWCSLLQAEERPTSTQT